VKKRAGILSFIEDRKKIISRNGIFDNFVPLRSSGENPGLYYHLFGVLSVSYGQSLLNGGSENMWVDTAARDVFLEHRVYKGLIENGLDDVMPLVQYLQKGVWENKPFTGKSLFYGIDNVKYCFDTWIPGIGKDVWNTVPENHPAEYGEPPDLGLHTIGQDYGNLK
jgi:hypothetical protein